MGDRSNVYVKLSDGNCEIHVSHPGAGYMLEADYLVSPEYKAKQRQKAVEGINNTIKHILEETNYTQMADYDNADRERWKEYRNQVRDIVNQPGYPLEVVWPKEPVPSIKVDEITQENITNGDVTLEEVKQIKIDESKTLYEQIIAKTINVSVGYTMDGGLESVVALEHALGVALRAEQPTMYVIDANNVKHDNVPLEDVVTMINEMTSNYMAQHEKKQLLRKQIEEADTLDELNAILINY